MSFATANRARKHASLPRPADLIPGGAPPAKRTRAACWTADENRFADWLMAQWNETVGRVGSRAYAKRRNRFVAIQFFRRINSGSAGVPPASDLERKKGSAGVPPANRSPAFNRETIRAGLVAYAENPINVKLGSWKRFHDFCLDAEEILEAQLKRIGHDFSTIDPRRAAAQKIADHKGLTRVAKLASQVNSAIGDYVAAQVASLTRRADTTSSDRRILDWYMDLAELCTCFGLDLSAAQQDAYRMRGGKCFLALHGRPPKSYERNELLALALAIFDLERKKGSAGVPPAASTVMGVKQPQPAPPAAPPAGRQFPCHMQHAENSTHPRARGTPRADRRRIAGFFASTPCSTNNCANSRRVWPAQFCLAQGPEFARLRNFRNFQVLLYR